MLKFLVIGNVVVAELINEALIITEVQEMLDLMGDSGANDCYRLILNEKNLHSDFFRLHTGFAGEILQKFSTYGFKLAIIGDFSKYKSKSFQDFIHESNRGNRIFFVENLDIGLSKLAGK
jgi:Domain of unknown function (DUF4180)